jgi:hypothetical protein
MRKETRHLLSLVPPTIALLLLFATVLPPAEAATLRVGPSQPIKRIAEAAFLAKDGDIVEIHGGEYRGDVAIWAQKKLTIRGVGNSPVLIANGRSAEAKAIWVIRDGNFDIENIEFRGARVIHDNGAGIRFERGKLTIRNCRFIDNQNGILTGNQPNTELTILDSHFSDAPRQPGALTHLLYAGRIARLVVQGSRFENGFEGHLIKSRARRNDIRYNWIVDGDKGEASYEIDLPDGGIGIVVGNVIGQGRSSQNPVLVAYGAEGRFWDENSLLFSHNTLVSARKDGSVFLRVWQGLLGDDVAPVVANNVLIGSGEFRVGESARIFGNHAAGALDFAPGFVPTDRSGLLKVPARPLPDGLSADGIPAFQFVAPVGRRPISSKSGAMVLIPGAIQPSRP